ncbi:hypothetical protein [Mesorhizobium sp. B2-3-15]|uniref:hypothetical protein n=1 Tax=Mesorhizobium sp. B2-3-15 TaxID=2589949 RepID=UPI001AED2968|nr:hypothetical protein [Mesorhizobium sp. B2-3-15]
MARNSSQSGNEQCGAQFTPRLAADYPKAAVGKSRGRKGERLAIEPGRPSQRLALDGEIGAHGKRQPPAYVSVLEFAQFNDRAMPSRWQAPLDANHLGNAHGLSNYGTPGAAGHLLLPRRQRAHDRVSAELFVEGAITHLLAIDPIRNELYFIAGSDAARVDSGLPPILHR